MAQELALVVSGASGMVLARRFAVLALESGALDALHVVITEPAHLVLAHELGPAWSEKSGFEEQLPIPDALRALIHSWSDSDLLAPVASGSNLLIGTVVLPCSSGMAGSIANGISRGLGQRVADVALKQGWPLIIGIRETPMSSVLLDNLLRLSRAGARVVPPVPAFYVGQQGNKAMDRFVDHYCLRVLDLIGLPTEGRGLRWKG